MNFKLITTSLFTAAALMACDANTTDVNNQARPLTSAEVAQISGRARTELAPRLMGSIRALAPSQVLTDLDIDLSELPADQELVDVITPTMDAILGSIESETATEIVYRVPPEQVCAQDSGHPNADCLRVLTAHPVRFVATSHARDQVTLTAQFGTRRLSPLRLDLTADRVEADLDLAVWRDVVIEYGADMEIDASSIPADVEGVIHLAAGATDLAISSALGAHVGGTVEGESFMVAVGPMSLALDVDTAGHVAIGSVDIASIDIEAPLAWGAEEGATGQLALALHGLRGQFNYAALTDTLVVDDLSFGNAPATLSLDGVQQISFDMNAALGHQVDASFRYLRQEMEIAVSPSVEASLDLSMDRLAQQVDLEPWMINDSIRLRFDGATSPTVRVGGEAEMIGRVVSGTLVIGSMTIGADECFGVREDDAMLTSLADALMSFPCE